MLSTTRRSREVLLFRAAPAGRASVQSAAASLAGVAVRVRIPGEAGQGFRCRSPGRGRTATLSSDSLGSAMEGWTRTFQPSTSGREPRNRPSLPHSSSSLSPWGPQKSIWLATGSAPRDTRPSTSTIGMAIGWRGAPTATVTVRSVQISSTCSRGHAFSRRTRRPATVASWPAPTPPARRSSGVCSREPTGRTPGRGMPGAWRGASSRARS
jgi:hypothetical protein